MFSALRKPCGSPANSREAWGCGVAAVPRRSARTVRWARRRPRPPAGRPASGPLTPRWCPRPRASRRRCGRRAGRPPTGRPNPTACRVVPLQPGDAATRGTDPRSADEVRPGDQDGLVTGAQVDADELVDRLLDAVDVGVRPRSVGPVGLTDGDERLAAGQDPHRLPADAGGGLGFRGDGLGTVVGDHVDPLGRPSCRRARRRGPPPGHRRRNRGRGCGR